jgi:hypothetical protein
VGSQVRLHVPTGLQVNFMKYILLFFCTALRTGTDEVAGMDGFCASQAVLPGHKAVN